MLYYVNFEQTSRYTFYTRYRLCKYKRKLYLDSVALLSFFNWEIRIHNQLNDNNGNYIIQEVTIKFLNFILVNIHVYGPNTDSLEFYLDSIITYIQ